MMTSYRLKNLDCADCALKIEKSLRQRSDVKEVHVYFAAATLRIDTDNIQQVKKHISEIEPQIVLLNSARETEKTDYKREVIILVLFSPLYAGGMVLHSLLPGFLSGIPAIAAFAVVYLGLGWRVLFKAFKNILKGRVFDESFLMATATIGAIIIRAFPEAAGVMLFYSIGLFFEDLAVNRSRRSVESLMAMKPDRAVVLDNGTERETGPENVSPGQIIIVRPGERIPLDGTVAEGEAAIDTSALTGESVPKKAAKGDEVKAGTINTDGLLQIKVKRPFIESSVSKILDLVQNALAKKAKTEKFITKFASVYTPLVVGAAVLIAVIPPFVLSAGPFSEWLYRALVALVVSCPCALVISIPLGYFAGIGKASSEGILIKGSNYIDIISKLDTLVFDKTGTLTKGNFEVTEINPRNGYTADQILGYAALAEKNSGHPVARAIIRKYSGNTDRQKIASFKNYSGMGIQAVTDKGRTITVGNDLLLHKLDIPHADCEINRTVAYVCIDNEYTGNIIINDEIRDEAGQTIRDLRRAGIRKMIMLTGDSKDVAADVSARLGLDEFHAELLPEDKEDILAKIKTENPESIIAFAGDGINDAPVLARADLGIAMGREGTDAAIETADMVLMTDNLSKIEKGISIGKRTRRIVLQNIVFALAVKIGFIALGTAGIAGMWEAVFADVGVTVLAVLNAMRIIRK